MTQPVIDLLIHDNSSSSYSLCCVTLKGAVYYTYVLCLLPVIDTACLTNIYHFHDASLHDEKRKPCQC